MSTGDVIGIIGLIILGLTLLAVCWYAFEARRQAEATRLAVEVSRLMTTEMREQRLAEDTPLLVMDMTNFTTGGMRLDQVKAIEDCYPDTIAFRVRNVGSGPAIDVDMTVIHPKASYWRSASKGYLLTDESLEYETGNSFARSNGLSLSECLGKIGVDTTSPEIMGLVVTYRDIHEQRWIAWLAIDYDWDSDGDGKPIWFLNEAGQHAAKFTSDEHRSVLFGAHPSLAAADDEPPGNS